MAQQVLVTLTDDLDGSKADETVTFALDGANYEIDLNAKNAAALRKVLDRYMVRARKPSGAHRGRSSSRRTPRAADLDPKAVRAWALDHGLEISSRGRIPSEIVSRYRDAGGA